MGARRREGMAFMLAAVNGSGGISPLFAIPLRPLIRLSERSLCRALTATEGCLFTWTGGHV